MEHQERALCPPSPPTAVDSDSVDPVTGVHPLADSEAQDCVVKWVPKDQGLTSVEENAVVSSDAVFHYNALLDKIVRQVEYYFSDGNLPNDKFLLNQIRKDKEGYVPVTVIASFKKMKKLTKDLSIIEAALRTSSQIVVRSDGKKVKRLQPLPLAEVRDVKMQTVLVENLPEDHSEDNIRRIFGAVGHIVQINICDPHSEEALATLKKPDVAISRKLHALIEYDTIEAAEYAVSTLNDENNWSGMRVQVLLERLAKYGKGGHFQKAWKDVPSEKNEKNNGANVLEMLARTQDVLEKEEEKLENVGGMGGRRRNKARIKGHHHQPTNDQGCQPKSACGQGHGSAPSGSNTEGGTTNKPIPGPRMPDGTRGFTMGRGRTIIT